MSFDVAVQLTRGDRRIGAAFRTGAGVTVLFGRSGVGKTSVLDMIAGLLRPDKGHARVAGEFLYDRNAGVNLPPERRRVGYVFQDPRLFPHKRVRANLLYGAPNAAKLADTARMLDIAHLLDRWPRTLSGGEARRVAIGRALLSDPAFLLLDEPLSSLDAARAEEVMRALERLRDETGLPMLLVTHDEGEAERLGNHRVAMY
ncbi:ATP-binding cassette domain-containing protein [uncultured Sphingomonas sp.]|uniref:ATP-binding cassette domain-containing protein n=1 Tax=uncultured Sphingomonas sp. TaxID=158754 RepID=UPI0035CAF1B7